MNFVRILKGLVVHVFSAKVKKRMVHVRGGEKQKGSLTHNTGYSDKAQRIGKPSYLEPNSGSLHVPIEWVYLAAAEKIEGRVAIGEKHNQCHVESASRFY